MKQLLFAIILISSFSTLAQADTLDATTQKKLEADLNSKESKKTKNIKKTENKGEENSEWDDYFMPGLGYKAFIPKDSEMGVYHGLVTEFVIYARARGENPKYSYRSNGPARMKSYINLSIMKSDKASVNDIFITNLGFNASFEGAKFRNYLIPYFGLELGGLYQKDFGTFHVDPMIGVQIVSSKKMLWNVYSSYQYTTKQFDEWSGITFGTTLNVLLWN
jgi:hypothetical protein